jgi:hypothetical protein
MVRIKCKEPDCPHHVVYFGVVVSGTGELARRDYDAGTPIGSSKRVYLECPNGHSHDYVVTV